MSNRPVPLRRPARPIASAVVAVFAVENLESRRLMAATLPRLGDVLGYLATDFATRPAASQARSVIRHKHYSLAARQPNADIVQTDGDTVFIKAVANAKGGKSLATQLAALGATVTSRYGRTLTAAVPVSALAKVNALSTLQYADASYAPIHAAGNIDDYGVQAMNADKGQKQYAVDGTGVTVGILSDSYNKKGGAAAGVASGDLPNVNVVKEYPYAVNPNANSPTDEGRAMAEIVHDVAPGAGISFYTADAGEADFANGILSLAGGGAKVVVDDVAYLDEPFFQDGVVAQAVNTAYSTYGTSYFSAAGNEGRRSFEAGFGGTSGTVAATTVQGGTTAVGSGTYEDFDTSAGTNLYQAITVPAGASIALAYQWNSPFYSASSAAGGTAGSGNNVSLYLLNSTKSYAVTTATFNRVGGDAYQVLSYSNDTAAAVTYYLVAKADAGAAPTYAKFIDYGTGTATLQYATNSGTAVGHAVAANGRAVGAAFYGSTPAFNVSPAVKESFSSAGGVPIFFNPNGTSTGSAVYRNQPSVVGPDGAATTFFSSQQTTFDGLYHFFGTSAAAPHVAAVAALLLQAKPSLSAAQVYSTLETTAVDMGTAGFDYDTGYGLVDANAALTSVAASSISGTVFRDANANGAFDTGDTAVGGQTVFLDSNNNGVADAGSSNVGSTTAVAIPDGALGAPSRVSSTITTALAGRVTGLTVTIDAAHAHTGDLGFTLITPSGVRIPLLTNLGYVTGNGTGINLTLSDAASTYVQSVYNPNGVLTGTYKPQTPLAAAVGENATGTWQLEARDYQAGSTGTINGWTLGVTYADPTAATTAAGVYTFSALTPSAFYGTYRVRTATLSGYTMSVPASAYDLTLARSSTVTARNFAFTSTAAPATIASVVIDDGTAQRSRVRSVTFNVSGTVAAGGIAAGAFTLTQTAAASGSTAVSSWTVNVSAVTTPAAGQTAITLTFGGPLEAGSLGDGRYSLLIDGSKITDANGTKLDAAGSGAAGSARTVTFFRLFADVDGNATVNFNDFLVLQNAFGTTPASPGFVAGLDYDGNNVIDFNDFLALQNEFGRTV